MAVVRCCIKKRLKNFVMSAKGSTFALAFGTEVRRGTAARQRAGSAESGGKSFFEKKSEKILSVQKMVVILQRFFGPAEQPPSGAVEH